MFKPISLENKELFDDLLSRYPPAISEMTFTNLFAWRQSKPVEFDIVDGHLVVKVKGVYYQPIGPEPEKTIIKIIKQNPMAVFERIEKKVADKCNSLKVEPQPDMNDYVYKINDLMELKGHTYEAKRNFIKRFREFSPDICLLAEDNVHLFWELQKKWCNLRQCPKDKELMDEHNAIKELLTNLKHQKVFGVCITINGELEGFAIGERLNENTFVEHFEKANSKFTGIYQYLLHEFANKIEGYEFLNREQDLGIEGLKKAKLSWGPAFMTEKFRISNLY
jgi:hypothetical protein